MNRALAQPGQPFVNEATGWTFVHVGEGKEVAVRTTDPEVAEHIAREKIGE